MYFSDDYFKGEEICGFWVRPMMKRYWAAHQEVIQELDRICGKLGIKYYADYGTLLGAVRHKGFIPWDDDVDICMLRGDYNIFREKAPLEFEDGMMIFNDRKTALAPMRITNTYAPQISEEFLKKYHGCPYPVGIDIYAIDRLPQSNAERNRFKELHQCIKYAAQRADEIYMSKEEHDMRYSKDIYNDKEFERLLKVIEKATSVTLNTKEGLSHQLTYLLDKVQSMYWTEDNEEVVYMHGWASGGRKPLPESYYGDQINLPFESIMIKAPSKYTEILVERFGKDYMTPQMQIAGHMYPGYRKSQEILCNTFEQCGLTPPPDLIDEMIMER